MRVAVKKTIMQRIGIILGIWLLAGTAFAQQQAQYTQYIFNGLVINPAYAGSKEIWNINAIYRNQWAGLEGAPTTMTLAADGAILKNKLGLGLKVINDKLGAEGQLSVLANGAVHLSVSETGKLSFGLAGGIRQYSLDGTKLKTTDPNDPSIPATRESTIIPDAEAGMFFHTEKFYAGLSGTSLIGFKSPYVLTRERNYFLTSGYVFNLGEDLKFKPSFLLKSDFKAPSNIDFNAFLLYKELFWIGGSYRTGLHLLPEAEASRNLDLSNAMAVIVELYLTKKIKVGYSYDFTLNGLSNFDSHEISLGYYFFKNETTRMLSPRYF